MSAASGGCPFRGGSAEAVLGATVLCLGTVEVNPGMALGAARRGTK